MRTACQVRKETDGRLRGHLGPRQRTTARALARRAVAACRRFRPRDTRGGPGSVRVRSITGLISESVGGKKKKKRGAVPRGQTGCFFFIAFKGASLRKQSKGRSLVGGVSIAVAVLGTVTVYRRRTHLISSESGGIFPSPRHALLAPQR